MNSMGSDEHCGIFRFLGLRIMLAKGCLVTLENAMFTMCVNICIHCLFVTPCLAHFSTLEPTSFIHSFIMS